MVKGGQTEPEPNVQAARTQTHMGDLKCVTLTNFSMDRPTNSSIGFKLALYYCIVQNVLLATIGHSFLLRTHKILPSECITYTVPLVVAICQEPNKQHDLFSQLYLHPSL